MDRIAGDIANEHGDLFFAKGGPLIAEGRLLVSFEQAFAAMRFGWRWIETDDGRDIVIRRGRDGLWSRRP